MKQLTITYATGFFALPTSAFSCVTLASDDDTAVATGQTNVGCKNCEGLTSLQSVRGCVLQSTDGKTVNKFQIFCLQFSNAQYNLNILFFFFIVFKITRLPIVLKSPMVINHKLLNVTQAHSHPQTLFHSPLVRLRPHLLNIAKQTFFIGI